MLNELKGKKLVAWGATSKLFEFCVTRLEEYSFAYLVDSNTTLQGTKLHGLEVRSPETLDTESAEDSAVVLFAVSNLALQEMLASLRVKGFLLGKNVFLYSDLFAQEYAATFTAVLGRAPDERLLRLAQSFCLHVNLPVHTTMLGNALFLELLSCVARSAPSAAIAEVGAFNGGNALLASQYLLHGEQPPFYVIDSFEGFPELSKHDPAAKKAGDYAIEKSYESIVDQFAVFPNVRVLKGFVPDVFHRLKASDRFSLVFYDCDLYQPALDTFEYFWDRLIPGGYMLVHDYVAETNGFHGVRKATDEFFAKKGVQVHEFWENTMGLIIKPGHLA